MEQDYQTREMLKNRLVGWGAMHRARCWKRRKIATISTSRRLVAHYAGLKAARTLGLLVVAEQHTLFEEYLQHYAPFLPGGWLRNQARAFSRRYVQC